MRLLPGRLNDPIEVELYMYHLYDPPSYDVLSQMWVDFEMDRTIVCQGSKLGVGRYLFGILESLRQRSQTRLLWIESICIDHANPIEIRDTKSVMALISESATRTLCWIKSTDTLRRFVSLTLELGQYRCAVAECFSATDPFRSSYRVTEQDLHVFRDFASQLDDVYLDGMETFLEQPYLERYEVRLYMIVSRPDFRQSLEPPSYSVL